jgi:hypothetical protein
VHTTLDYRYLAINQKFCDILGYTREELMRMDTLAITHPDDRDVDDDHLRAVGSRHEIRRLQRRVGIDRSGEAGGHRCRGLGAGGGEGTEVAPPRDDHPSRSASARPADRDHRRGGGRGSTVAPRRVISKATANGAPSRLTSTSCAPSAAATNFAACGVASTLIAIASLHDLSSGVH